MLASFAVLAFIGRGARANYKDHFQSSGTAPGISTAELGIFEGGGSLARGKAFDALPLPFVTAAGLIGLNAEPGAADAKEEPEGKSLNIPLTA